MLFTNQNIDDDDNLLYSEDPLSVDIDEHYFGPTFGELSIDIIRIDDNNPPYTNISIIRSDTESIRIYNLQPTDLLSIDNSNFIHSYINISLGEQNQSSFNNNFTK